MGTDSAETIIYNYWSNNSVVNVHAAIDYSPLQSPIDTSFDPSLFPLPFSFSETPQNVTERIFFGAGLAAIIILAVLILVIFKWKQRIQIKS
jgi:hypothetical protein